MLFGGDAVISKIWAYETNVKKAKWQAVEGRTFHSLSLRRSGFIRIEADGQHYTSHPNGITFMPAGLSYRTEVPEDGHMLVIQFTTVGRHDALQPRFFEAESDHIKKLFTRLCDDYRIGSEGDYHSMALLYSLLELLDTPRQPVPRRMRLAKARIDRQFAEPLTVHALAEEAGLSEVHFRSEFKKHFALSPLSYLKQVRIENAKLLLSSAHHTVTEVALCCGFESTSYFSSEFRRMTGMTPTQYIQKHTL